MSISNAIKSFNEKCEFVTEKRSNATTGFTFKEKLQQGYKCGLGAGGMQPSKPVDGNSNGQEGNTNGDTSSEYVEAYMDFDLAKALEAGSTAAV
eukprot:scaffold17505_cov71-Cylindrotheca_fusiformis.AAC.1